MRLDTFAGILVHLLATLNYRERGYSVELYNE
jgi:hypothetical protein